MKHWNDCTHEQRIERWVNVERVLKSLTPHERRKHWNMTNWGIKTECGTVACAAGHCGMDPWFRRRGFKLKPFTIPDGENPAHFDGGGFGIFEGGVVAEWFFGRAGCEQIFYRSEKRPVSQVIREVRAHIKQLRAGLAT